MLTDTAIRKAIRDGKARTLSEGSGRGSGRLLLMIRPAKSGVTAEWYAQQITSGRRKLSKLGSFPTMSLSEAREVFQLKFAPVIREGESIKTANHNQVGTVQELFADYVEHLRRNGKRSAYDAEKNLKRVAASIGASKAANKVTQSDVIHAIRPVYARGRKSMADHLRSYVRSAYSWAIKAQNDYRVEHAVRKFHLITNPAENIPTEPKVAGDRWLAIEELREFWRYLERGADPIPGKQARQRRFLVCVQVIIATGQRVEEIARIEASMLNLELGCIEWGKTKNGLPHVVPVAAWVMDLLVSLEPNEHGLLFGGHYHPHRHVDDQSLRHITAGYCERNRVPMFSPRDLRRTWKTLSGHAGLTKSERDMLQNHSRSDVSSRHYDRYDYLPEKRAAMQKWDAWFNREIKMAPEGAKPDMKGK